MCGGDVIVNFADEILFAQTDFLWNELEDFVNSTRGKDFKFWEYMHKTFLRYFHILRIAYTAAAIFMNLEKLMTTANKKSLQ